MTNSSKKVSEKKAAREILDSDLDARLDQATSTLPLDDEPPSGDAIDVMLKRAKKILDAQLPVDELQEVPEEKAAKPKRKRSKAVDEQPISEPAVDPEETNKLVSFNDTLAKIEEDIAALHAEKAVEDVELLDTPEETAAMDALLDSVAGDISTFTVDDILDEVVELDAPVENNEPEESVNEIDEVEIPAVDTDDVLDEIVELDAAAENNELNELVSEIDEVEIPAIDTDDVLDEIVELDAPVENKEIEELVNEIDEVEIPAVDTDDVLDEIVELDAPVENNELNELVSEIDEVEIPAVDIDDVLDEIVELDAAAENNELNELASEIDEVDIPAVDTDDVLDEIVELDAPVENNEIEELVNEIDEVEIPAIDTDDVLDEIVELDAPVENNEIEELVNEIDEVEIPAVDVDDALDDIIELDTFVENDEISKLLDDVQEDEKAELSENNNLDGLLDSTGFDFDFDLLLDEISDELKAEISEESSVIEAEIKADSFDNTLDKDAILDEEEYNAQDVVKTVESIEQTEADDSELNVDINAALDDLIDSLPFEDVLTTDSQNEINTVEEEFNNFDDVADTQATPLFEMSASEESLDDNFDEIPQLEGLNDTMENTKETTSGFDLLDDNATDNAYAMPANEANDLDWLDQMGKDDTQSDVASLETEKSEDTVADDDDGWITGDDDDTSVASSKAEDTSSDDDDGWITGDDDDTSIASSKAEDTSSDDDDGWITGDDDDTSIASSKAEDTSSDDDDGWITGDDDDTSIASSKAEDTSSDDDDGWITGDDDSAEDVEIDEPKQEPVKMSKEPTPAVDVAPVVAAAAAVAAVAAFDEGALIAKVKEELKGEKDHELARLRADQDKVEAHAKKQFAGLEDAKKKNTTLSYIALGVGIIGLIGSGGVGYMAYNSKNEEAAINEHVTHLDEKINNFLAKNPEKEIENIKNSVEQLNQKIDKLAATQITPPVSNVISPTIAPEIAPVEATQEPVIKEETKPEVKETKKEVAKHEHASSKGKTKEKEDVKTVAEPKSSTTEKSDSPVNLLNSKPSSEKPKAEAPAVIPELNAIVPPDAPKSEEKSADSAKKTSEKPVEAPKEATSQKVDNAEPVKVETFDSILKEAPYTGRMTRGMAFGRAKENGEKHHTHAHKEVLNANIAEPKVAPAGKYSVNVVSYQQEWFAESKAAELRQQGIPVEVAPVDINDSGTRYRLKVTGFKTKGEANTYASKVKKTSGFADTWVGTNE